MMEKLWRYLPILSWGAQYSKQTLFKDLFAAVIVSIMLIPQALAYALLAGLPPEAGIYASVLPMLLYAVFGSSTSLSVGPVAVVSLLSASALAEVAQQGTADYATAALSLALLCAGILLLLAALRLGALASLLSHPVISGFISASGILIAASALKHVLGIQVEGHNLIEIIASIIVNIGAVNGLTMLIALLAIGLLFWLRKYLHRSLLALGISHRTAEILTRAGPVFVVVGSTAVVGVLRLDSLGVQIVGEVPKSLPPFTLPNFSIDLLRALLPSALLISLIGFVESVSVAQTLAAKRRERIDPNRELIGLGMANLGAAFSGGYPVTGGFSRSIVNFDAGAATPAAGAFTGMALAIAGLGLTPLLYFLPKATLAATIIVAVLALVDFSILRKTWVYSRADFAAVVMTMTMTLVFGVEIGVAAGVVLSIGLHLYKTSKPHVAELGLLAGTEHFRNIHRHRVVTDPSLLILRIDESLYFVNAGFLETLILQRIVTDPKLKHIVINCAAINEIDFSALETLMLINTRLRELAVGLHLSELKGPLMERLNRDPFLAQLNGKVFLSTHQAWLWLRRRDPKD